jgi:hypothetical protein
MITSASEGMVSALAQEVSLGLSLLSGDLEKPFTDEFSPTADFGSPTYTSFSKPIGSPNGSPNENLAFGSK